MFSRADGTSLGEGDLLVQKDLAATLEAIAENISVAPDGQVGITLSVSKGLS